MQASSSQRTFASRCHVFIPYTFQAALNFRFQKMSMVQPVQPTHVTDEIFSPREISCPTLDHLKKLVTKLSADDITRIYTGFSHLTLCVFYLLS